MREIDVRRALHAHELSRHLEEPDTIIVDEMGICHGQVIVDIMVINGTLHGYEIKSQSDNLDRLPHQITAYSSCLDLATLVVAEGHLTQAAQLIPDWWGLMVARGRTAKDLRIELIREASQNQAVDPAMVVKLLWREEAVDLLRRLGIDRGVTSATKKVIYDRICKEYSIVDLRNVIRDKIRSRRDWRVDSRRTPCDG